MADPSVFFLFYQIRVDSVFLVVQIGVDIFLTDIVEEIEVKIVYLAFLQLFLKDLFYPGHIGKVIAGEFAGETEGFPGIFLKDPAHDQFCIPVVITPGGVIIVDAVFHGVVHHAGSLLFIDPGIVAVCAREPHSSKPEADSSSSWNFL